jgi:hypothetical protein
MSTVPETAPTASRPAVLPLDADLLARSIPPDVEPSSDIEWLIRESDKLAALGHDAGKAAAEALRSVVREMDSRGAYQIAQLEAIHDQDAEDHYQRYEAGERDLADMVDSFAACEEDSRDARNYEHILDYQRACAV